MNYVEAFESDAKKADEYLLKSVLEKTQQQIRLEEILSELSLQPERIADIACGAGGLSYHLSKFYPQSKFTLVDLGAHALSLARRCVATFGGEVTSGDIYDLPLLSKHYDLVFCWQTLSWLDDPYHALEELIRICRPGGRVFLSALFNTEYDVDLYTEAVDYTREGNRSLKYTTFSARTIAEWTKHPLVFHNFTMPIDIPKTTRGLGTHTVGPERLQVSAGMLMNWEILEIRKAIDLL